MKYTDLLIIRDTKDLKLAMDALATYWYSIPVPNRPKGDIGLLASDILSYRRRLDNLPKEYISTLWAGVNYLLDKLQGVSAREIVDESKVIRNNNAITTGKYWIINGEFHKCKDSHRQYIMDNQNVFIDKLGIDGWRLMRSRHSQTDDIIRLALVSGGAIAVVDSQDGEKCVKYQCCNEFIPQLKEMASKMAFNTSFFRIYDPSKPYSGFNSGILFVIHH